MKIGLQQLQLGSILKNHDAAKKALLSMRQSGFDYIELNGFMIRKTPLLARLLLSLSGMGIKKSQKLGWPSLLSESKINVLSIHEDLDTLEKNMDAVKEEIKLYHPEYIVLTGMYRYPYDQEEAIGSLIVRLNRIGRALANEGTRFLYHNHSVEFQNVEGGEKAYQMLIDGLNPDWVNFEFDSYWAIEAGADPIYWMNKLGKRLVLYHVCDRGSRQKGPYLTPIIKTDALELGEGSINLPSLLDTAISNGVEGIILEQHKNYIAKDPVASISVSGKYLQDFFAKTPSK